MAQKVQRIDNGHQSATISSFTTAPGWQGLHAATHDNGFSLSPFPHIAP